MPTISEGRKRRLAVLQALQDSLRDTAMRRDNRATYAMDLTMEEVVALRDAVTEEKHRLLGH